MPLLLHCSANSRALPTEMKSLLRIAFGVTLFACVVTARVGFAQRFTSAPQGGQTADSTYDNKGELAYEALESGNLDDARNYLDAADPGDPYAMFVRASLTSDALTAANMYKEIVAENEGKPIAREALVQLFNYHYAKGDYQAAHSDYLELKKFPIPPPVSDPIGLRDSLQSAPVVQAPRPQPPAEEAGKSAPRSFIVQLGVFTTPENAQRYIQKLRTYGVTATVFTKDGGGRTLYGVSAGSFPSRDGAQDLANDLKGRAIDCIVVQR